ncbi:MAG: winged helix DNA-binding domain-containing protein, partial [Vicinamibacterales bacterium]
GGHLTRQELKGVLQRAGVRADSVQRLAHIVMQAEIDAVICSGARRGTQSTYALLDERVPPAAARSRDDALAELTRRYFTSHGPAQIGDFVWWSGLTTGDVRRGLELVDRELDQEVVDGKTYWFRSAAAARGDDTTAHLLGLYDEYLIAYKDRGAALDQSRWVRMVRDPFSAAIVVNGKVIGGWRRSVTAERMTITITPFTPLRRSEAAAVDAAAHAYAGFFGNQLEFKI